MHFLHLLDDVHRIQGLFQDEIQALRERVKELEKANASMASFLPEVRGCAFYMVAPDGSIQGWSGGARDIYGYSADEIIGQPASRLRPPVPSGAIREGLPTSPRIRKNGEVFEVFEHDAVLMDEEESASGRIHAEVPVDWRLRCADGGPR